MMNRRIFKDLSELPSEHPLSEDLKKYIEELRYDRKLQPGSINVYFRDLKELLELTPTANGGLARQKLRGLSSATYRRKLVIWQGFLRRCPSPWNALFRDISRPKIRQKPAQFLTEDEIFRLEAATYHGGCQARDRLLLGLGLQLGLRLSEILSLRFTQFEEGWLRLVRKGGHEQVLPLTKSLRALLQHWQKERRAADDEHLFVGRSGEALSARGAQKIVERLARRARIEKKITPHSLRHSFASRLAANGANLVAIKEILGHRSLQTTERYLHVTPEHLRESLNLLKSRPQV